ncbi:cysteine desulfurase [Lactococcus piscium]|uniref:Cysteine desulfurase n=2 Tax=Pseudolactococcus piscium TaxID=1364 RepID=A0A2A5S5V7_9LACT|nr:cysteine desulfurase [Lactococcus piscium]
MDTTFMKNKIGNFELSRILEQVPNSGDGPLLKIIVNSDLTGFKLSITDKAGLRHINIFKSPENKMIQDKFYFQMNALVDRGVFKKAN